MKRPKKRKEPAQILHLILGLLMLLSYLAGYVTPRVGFILTNGGPRAPRGFAGKLYASTLALYGTKSGVTKFLCTAEPFERISGGYHLMSAGHCVQMVPADVQFSVADNIGGKRTPVTVLKAYMGEGIDFSEFELKTKEQYSIFVLGNEHASHVGDQTINVNFSVGIAKQISYGHIASASIPASDACTGGTIDCTGDFMVQEFDAGGASGSAVVSEKTHQVIGLVTWGVSGETVGAGVEPISAFAAFLAGPTQPHPADEEN